MTVSTISSGGFNGKIWRIQLRWMWALTSVLMALLLLLSVFYLSHTYVYLSAWYLSLGSHIPYKTQWQNNYFTKEVKATGNWLCVGAIAVCSAYSWHAFRQWRLKKQEVISFRILQTDWRAICLICLFSAGLWAWGYQLSDFGADELFSAHYYADAHPFQAASNYSDPNNHVLFNLLNNIVFPFTTAKVVTGRVLSLLAYCAVNLLLFFFTRRLTSSNVIAALFVAVLAMQFQAWGYAVLARGYELYLLCHWVALIAFYKYQQCNNAAFCAIYMFASIAGFWVMPTYIYFFAALLAAAMIIQLHKRKLDVRFWQHTVLAGVGVLAIYLPVFLFFGPHAINGNKIVVAQSSITSSMFLEYLGVIFRECLRLEWTKNWLLYGFLLLLPIPLFFSKKDIQVRLLAGFYLLIWLANLILIALTAQFPHIRNLIFQEQFTLLMILLIFSTLGKQLGNKMRSKGHRVMVFCMAPVIALICYSSYYFTLRIDYGLYNVSTRKHNEEIKQQIALLPKGTTISAPDWNIAWYYFATKKGLQASTSYSGNEQLLIRHYDEPADTVTGYAKIKTYPFYYIFVKAGSDSSLIHAFID